MRHGHRAILEAVRVFFSSLLLSSLELSDTKVYEREIRSLLVIASHFCEVVVLESRNHHQAGAVMRHGHRAILEALRVFFSSLLLPSLELSGTKVYEP